MSTSSGASEGVLVPSPLLGRDDPRSPDVVALLEAHLTLMHTLSPPEDVHALDLEGLSRPHVHFFSVRRGSRDGELLAVGALAVLGDGPDGPHGELKSMHTRGDLRRTGIARMLVRHLLDEARGLGLRRVSLETGTQAEFGPARSLYASEGFEVCGPFGDYAESPFSTFMTRTL